MGRVASGIVSVCGVSLAASALVCMGGITAVAIAVSDFVARISSEVYVTNKKPVPKKATAAKPVAITNAASQPPTAAPCDVAKAPEMAAAPAI